MRRAERIVPERVTLFGRVGIQGAGGTYAPLKNQAARILLCLAVHAAVSGEEALARLDVARCVYNDFDDRDLPAMRGALNVAVTELRNALTRGLDNPLPYDRVSEKYMLARHHVAVDAKAFRKAYDAARAAQGPEDRAALLQAAVAASEGTLDALGITSPRFLAEFEKLKAWQADARYRLALCHEEQGNAEMALECARRAIAADPAATYARDMEARLEARLTSMRTQLAKPKRRNSLPLSLTSFVGREEEAEEVRSLLGERRLLTLTGTGGCGKTRLALRVAADVQERFADGVFLAELAPLADPTLLLQTVAQLIGIPMSQSGDPAQSLADGLQGREVLLVLDNCEHLCRECAHLAETLLRACPLLKVLTTSRTALSIAGEQVYRVPPLSLPGRRETCTMESVSRCDAARLFLERARLAQFDFALTEGNAHLVAELCRRLDGLPLALELAGARVRDLPPQAMLQLLTDVLALPHSPHRGVPSRHKSLRAALDWSYGLLPADLKAVFARQSVFAGGWDAAAAQAVCQEEETGEDVLLSLDALVDWSLVAVEERDGLPRYRFLEAVREYADEQWQDAAARARAKRRHRDFFLEVADAAVAHLHGPEQAVWLRRLEGEHNNFRAALRFSFATPGEEEAGLRLAVALWRFWEPRGYFAEGREWLETGVRSAPQAEPALRANALGMAGGLAYRGGDWPAAAALMTQGLDLYRGLGNHSGATHLLNSLGIMAYERGDYAAARAYNEESAALFRQQGDRQGEANALNGLGIVAWALGDLGTAQIRYEDSLAINRQLDNRRHIAEALNNLGLLAREQGDPVRARALLEESLARARTLDMPLVIAAVLCNVADLALTQGDCAAAAAGFVESLHRLLEIGSERSAIVCLEGLAQTAAAQGQPERAARLFGAGESLREQLGAVLTPTEAAMYAPALASVRATLDAQDFAAAWGQGRAMTLRQATVYAEHDHSG